MIREDRDAAFWVGVLSHPALAHVRGGADPQSIVDVLPRAIALRAEHGGFLFFPADSFGRAFEMHTAFTPEGWGREAFQAAREAFDLMFDRADLILTHETPHPQSRPPKTFRFQPLGGFADSVAGQVRLWVLTRDQWAASPAGRR